MALGWGDNSWGDNGWGGAIPITGTAATAAVSSATQDSSVGLSGLNASGGIGIVQIPPRFASITGVSSDGFAFFASPTAGTSITGVSSQGYVYNGWGQSTWGDGAWGGSLATSFELLRNISGVSSLGAISSASPNLSPSGTGVEASGAAGDPVFSRSAALTSVVAQGYVYNGWGQSPWGEGTWGSVLLPEIFQSITGVDGSGAVGSVAYPGPSFALTGTFAVGNDTNPIFEKVAAITGASGRGAVGNVVQLYSYALTGAVAYGKVGSVSSIYWSTINDSQTAEWEDIDNSQTVVG